MKVFNEDGEIEKESSKNTNKSSYSRTSKIIFVVFVCLFVVFVIGFVLYFVTKNSDNGEMKSNQDSNKKEEE